MWTTGVSGTVKGLGSALIGLALAVAGRSTPSASVNAAAFLTWCLGSMMLCLLWFAVARRDRIAGNHRPTQRRSAYELLGIAQFDA